MMGLGATDIGFHYAVDAACYGGHRDLAELMFEKLNGNGQLDLGHMFNDWLCNACFSGHRDLVDLMIEKGADGWNKAFASACFGGQLDMAELMVQKGADEFSEGNMYARENGHRELCEMINVWWNNKLHL